MAFFSVSALILYTVLYQSALVPRWLSGWGFAGGVLLLISAVLAMFGADLGAAQAVFSAPIGLNEMVLAIWLIAKGFNPAMPETMREEAERDSFDAGDSADAATSAANGPRRAGRP